MGCGQGQNKSTNLIGKLTVKWYKNYFTRGKIMLSILIWALSLLSYLSSQVSMQLNSISVANPKIWEGPKILGAKVFDFWRITPFCMGYRLSKHKTTICSENLVGTCPFRPPLATPMLNRPTHETRFLQRPKKLGKFLTTMHQCQ